jgi:hypothetical protein
MAVLSDCEQIFDLVYIDDLHEYYHVKEELRWIKKQTIPPRVGTYFPIAPLRIAVRVWAPSFRTGLGSRTEAAGAGSFNREDETLPIDVQAFREAHHAHVGRAAAWHDAGKGG